MRSFQGQNYKWWAFLALALGLFTSVAYQGSVIVALPSIADDFGTDLPTTQWVLIGYTLIVSAFLLPMSRVADMVGRKPIYLAGFTIFMIGSGVAGASQGIIVMIIATMFQGLGAAMTQGTSMAMVIATFPVAERGRAIGLQLSVVGAGGIVGPTLGGFIISSIDWRWAFYGNMLLASTAVLAALVVLDAGRTGREAGDHGRFDWLGAILSSGALVTFLMGMTWGPKFGWIHPGIVSAIVAFAGLLVAFVWWELRYPAPMMDVRLFKRKLFSLGVMASYLSFIGMTAVRFLMPFYLQNVLGFSPSKIGLIILPSAAMMVFMGPISGRLSDRFGWRWFTLNGMVAAIAGLLVLATLTPQSTLAPVMVGMVLQSFGMGMFSPPNNSSILSAVEPSKFGVISGFLNLVRNAGSLTSVAMATAIVTATMGSMGYMPSLSEISVDGVQGLLEAFTAGQRSAYLALAGLLLGAFAASAFRGTSLTTIASDPEEGGDGNETFSVTSSRTGANQS